MAELGSDFSLGGARGKKEGGRDGDERVCWTQTSFAGTDSFNFQLLSARICCLMAQFKATGAATAEGRPRLRPGAE